MESDIYTTKEESDKLLLYTHRFLILELSGKKFGIEWCPSLGLYKIIDKKQWMLTKIEYGI